MKANKTYTQNEKTSQKKNESGKTYQRGKTRVPR